MDMEHEGEDDNETPPSSPIDYNKGREKFEQNIARGRTIMRKLIKLRSNKKKLSLEWNVKGQPIGPHAKDLVGFIGSIVREKVPITFEDWRYAKKSHGELVWLEIMVCLMCVSINWFSYDEKVIT